jgi:hypothetical protein
VSGLREAYARLANGASIELPADDLLEIERAGFVGLRLENGIVRAWKGKDGPCFETGRSARYRGAAAAALDDDRHLLFGTMRLCEKTASIYRLPAYAGLVEVTDATGSEKDAVPFDCDTFEADAAKLAASLAAVEVVDRVAILYPGPFKLLILKNGDIVRRGLAARVGRGEAELLKQRDGAVEAAGGIVPSNYLKEYERRGALCLLGDLEFGATTTIRRKPSLEALADAAEPMRRRLLKLIERGDDYFLLVGSDPADKDGCCPSDDVGRANALVRAGVLEGWTASAEASCPSTVYAFAGEITSRGEQPSFAKNEKLRASVREFIASKAGIPARVAVRLLWLALGLLGLALAVWALLRDLRS